MTALATYTKYSAELLDYAINWSFPDSDTVASAAWSVPDGDGALEVSADPAHLPVVNGSRTTAWLEGGTPGARYTARCTMTSTLGRIFVRDLAIQVAG
jgi:hypothetical protein